METVTIRDARFLVHIQRTRRALYDRSVCKGEAIVRRGERHLTIDYIIKEKNNGNENS